MGRESLTCKGNASSIIPKKGRGPRGRTEAMWWPGAETDLEAHQAPRGTRSKSARTTEWLHGAPKGKCRFLCTFRRPDFLHLFPGRRRTILSSLRHFRTYSIAKASVRRRPQYIRMSLGLLVRYPSRYLLFHYLSRTRRLQPPTPAMSPMTRPALSENCKSPSYSIDRLLGLAVAGSMLPRVLVTRRDQVPQLAQPITVRLTVLPGSRRIVVRKNAGLLRATAIGSGGEAPTRSREPLVRISRGCIY